MVTVEDKGTYAFETADGVKLALAVSAWKDAVLGVAPQTATTLKQQKQQTKVELSHLYLSSEALSHSETARRTSVISGRRVSAPVLITRMVEGSGRTALAAPATIAEGEEEAEEEAASSLARRRDSEQFEM